MSVNSLKCMIHLFIDTNRYLPFYSFEEELVKEIETLTHSINEKKVTLWLPEQVRNEFYRRREEVLSGYYNQIEMYKPSNLPNIPDFEDEKRKLADLKNKVNSLLEYIKNKFEIKNEEESFLADNLIKNLFSSAKFMPYDESVIKKAIRRIDLGNPPGKKGSYGDSIIWETLLKDFPEGEDLHFVGSDPHFKSKINEKEFSPFLLKEWENEKKSKIIVYNMLGKFIEKNIKEIKLSDKIIEDETKYDTELLLAFEPIMSGTTPDALKELLQGYTMSDALKELLQGYTMGDAIRKHNTEVLLALKPAMSEVLRIVKEESKREKEN